MKNILFVCRYNRFRSKVAEALFNKYNKNRSMRARSAGLIKGSEISEEIREAAENLELKIKGSPEGISTEILKWYDTMIIVADDVPSAIFEEEAKKYGKQVIIWHIPDTDSNRKEDIIRIIKQIDQKIKELLDEIKNNR